MIGAMAIAMPVIIAVVLLTILYSPLYLPFVLSFFIKAKEWQALRWSLRMASAAALYLWAVAMEKRPDFGNDVAGNIAGACYNTKWVWGSGMACILVALVLGLVLRAIRFPRTRTESMDQLSV